MDNPKALEFVGREVVEMARTMKPNALGVVDLSALGEGLPEKRVVVQVSDQTLATLVRNHFSDATGVRRDADLTVTRVDDSN